MALTDQKVGAFYCLKHFFTAFNASTEQIAAVITKTPQRASEGLITACKYMDVVLISFIEQIEQNCTTKKGLTFFPKGVVYKTCYKTGPAGRIVLSI